jgi:tripartite-type tricarboxylate transporter receptor subunit TctC
MTAVDSAAVKAKVDQLGIDLDTRKSPEEFQRFYLGELERWGAFIKKNQITTQ